MDTAIRGARGQRKSTHITAPCELLVDPAADKHGAGILRQVGLLNLGSDVSRYRLLKTLHHGFWRFLSDLRESFPNLIYSTYPYLEQSEIGGVALFSQPLFF